MVSEETANVGDYLLQNGRAGDVALIDRAGSHTYADLRQATHALEERITAWNLDPGSRVGLLSRNSLFWAAGYLATIRAGHVAVPFPQVLTPADVLRKARFVGCNSFLLDSALKRSFALVDDAAVQSLDEKAMSHGATTRDAVPPPSPDADAVLMFTSGTTSAPRAVRVSHRNIRANTDSIIQYLALTPRDRMMIVLPFSYCYGASLLHTHLRAGASVAICDTFAFPETAIEQIQHDACTGIAGVPSTFQLLLRSSSFESISLPTLRLIQQAGGRLPQTQIDRVAAAQPHADLFVMYGATEATSRMSYLPPERREDRQGSIGRGIPGVALSIIDESGQEVPPRTVGEVFARGESITRGYWNDPQGTAAKYVFGGLRTGDLGWADEDGYIYLVDRQADFIKSWGIRVSSQEIEDAVVTLTGVNAAAVVGRPDADAGEAIVLFYVASPDTQITPDDVRAHCRGTLAKHLVPHEIRQVAELPLNHNGKVVKSELKALAAAPTQPQEM